MLQAGLTVLITGLLLLGYLVFVIRRAQRKRQEKAEAAASARATGLAPVEARLPRALQGQRPEGDATPPLAPSGSPSLAPEAPLARTSSPPPGRPAPDSPPAAAAPIQPPPVPPPAPVAPAPATAPAAEAVLPRLARGVTLPCDLGPLIDIAPRAGAAERVAFITQSFPGEVVQRELESTFEGIGGHISWFGPDVGVLRRDGLEANVALYMAPRSVFLDGAEAFPTAALGSVVVDLWVDQTR